MWRWGGRRLGQEASERASERNLFIKHGGEKERSLNAGFEAVALGMELTPSAFDRTQNRSIHG